MRNRKLRIIGLLAVLILLLSACNLAGLRGSGKLITETRNVRNFERVTLSGSGDVIITQSGEESLVVETDDNIMEYVTTEVRGGTLELGFSSAKGGAISPTRLTFTLSVDNLEGLTVTGSGDIEGEEIETNSLEVSVSGSGDIRIDSVTADFVEVQISGSGNIDLAGIAAEQDIQIGGSGKYRAEDLRSETVTVEIGGSGDVTVWATNSLDASIGGSGTVNYYGRPSVSSSTSGSGSVNGLGDKG